MASANTKVTLTADIKKIWDIVTSCDNYAWRSDLSKIEVVESGRRFIEYTNDGYATTFTITVYEPYERYEFDLDNSNLSGHWTGVFTCEDGVVTADLTEEVTAKKIWMKPIIGAYLKRQQALYIQDLKKELGLLC